MDIKAYEDISIVEMGANHQGEIAAYCNYTEPNFGVITNIGKAHLEGFGGIEGVIKGKTELYRYLANNLNSKIFINADDYILTKHTSNLLQILYGTNPVLPIHGKILVDNSDNLSVSIYEADTTYLIRTKLAGDYNLYNVLLAFSIGRYFEIDAVKIVQALESYQPSNSRSQIIKSGDTTIILDAYNANPSSMEVALFNLAKFEGKRIAILGAMKEMGNHSEEEHKKILELALNLNINIIVAIGIEFSEVISSKTIQYFETTEEAKNWYKQQKFGRDTILIKGSRGMALEKILE